MRATWVQFTGNSLLRTVRAGGSWRGVLTFCKKRIIGQPVGDLVVAAMNRVWRTAPGTATANGHFLYSSILGGLVPVAVTLGRNEVFRSAQRQMRLQCKENGVK